MSSAKSKFPGRPMAKNGHHKVRRFSKNSNKSKRKMPTANFRECIDDFLKGFQDDEPDFHGYSEESIQAHVEKGKVRKSLIETAMMKTSSESEEDFHGFTEREIKLSKKELKSRKEKLQKAIKKVHCYL